MIRVEAEKQLALPSGKSALRVAFDLEPGSFTVLYGPSGSGKTTLLKILAGLVRPEKGFIQVGDQTWLDTQRKQWVPPQKRPVGLVFQDYALFPNLTVRQNLRFGLPDPKDQQRVEELLALTGLTDLADRHPHTLSGGQQQRVALARTLVRRPQLLLLDEPFAALDLQTKQQLRTELLRFHRQFNLTTILVSHDPVEIYQLSDSVIELDAGRVVRQGKSRDLFGHRESSAKVQLYGQVVQITPSDIVFVVHVQAEQQVIRVVATAEEVRQLRVGDKVQVTAKAFNPMLTKLG